MPFFPDVPKIAYEGPKSTNPFAFRHYDETEVVEGKTMKEHFRFAVAYWHTMRGSGSDPFGPGCAVRPWEDGTDSLDMAKKRVKVAFEFMEKLGVPYYCFHDRDVAPEGDTLAESNANLDAVAKVLEGRAGPHRHQAPLGHGQPLQQPAVRPRGEHELQRRCVRLRRRSGEEGDGGHPATRRRELRLLGRPRGVRRTSTTPTSSANSTTSPSSCTWPWTTRRRSASAGSSSSNRSRRNRRPTSTTSTPPPALAFLRGYGLIGDFKLNIETNHATLAGHTMMHELEYARVNGLLGSIDANRGDELIGWDTDQFPTNLYLTAQVMLVVLEQGGLGSGGFNFDAKVRRESFEPSDLFHAHVGSMDAFAQGLKIAAAIRKDGVLKDFVKTRYGSWDGGIGASIEAGKEDFASLEAYMLKKGEAAANVSGRQEMLENVVNRYLG